MEVFSRTGYFRTQAEFSLYVSGVRAFDDAITMGPGPAARATMRRAVDRILGEAAQFYGFTRDAELRALFTAHDTDAPVFSLVQQALRNFPDWALKDVIESLNLARCV